MTDEIIISVIVPVYNVEKYIRDCLDSIVRQSFTAFEVILVDDGSTDNSSIICEEYAKQDVRFVVVHKSNGGLSDARNVGLEHANGQYIVFIDSDDKVSEDYLQVLINAIIDNDADMVCCSFEEFQDEDSIDLKPTNNTYNFELMDGKTACELYYGMTWTICINAWAKLYKRELFDAIRFPKGRVYEDQGTTPKLWFLSKKIVHISEAKLYKYRVRNGSISRSDFSPKAFDDVWNVEQCVEYFDKKQDIKIRKMCENFRNVLQAKYIVLAHSKKKEDCIPKQYKRSLIRSLRVIYKKTPQDTFMWYLKIVFPKMEKPFSYMFKVKGLIKKNNLRL